jgi:hypothetical protein
MTDKEEQRLQKLTEKMAEMQAQRLAILSRDRERQRKERTRRLIQNGALAEKYLACEGLDSVEFEKVLRDIANSQHFKDMLSNSKK